MSDVDLRSREGVELIRTGTWQISTGEWTAAREDLAAAVAARSCPAVRRPYLKLGHTDSRFAGDGDAEPALGWFDNLRLADGGHTLVADQEGVPAWLDSVMATAYPDRSVEGVYNYRCQLGHTHPFVLTGVAALGVTPPGVGTLRSLTDLRDVFDVAASEAADGAVPIHALVPAGKVAAAADVHTGAMVALIPSDADAQRLAVDGGEPADQLHVTLAYLGTAADLGTAIRQDIIDRVSSAINGMPQVDANAFALSVFNPGGADACIVLGVGGGDVDTVHTLTGYALDGLDLPEQHTPWVAHLTLAYTDDLTMLADLVDRVGPVVFDRVRIALAGETIDIPLIGDDSVDDAAEPIAAAADENQLKRYWLGDGLKKWATSPHPWTALYRHLRKYVGSERAKRIASEWFHDHFGYWPGDRRNLAASADRKDVMPNPAPSLTERIHAAWNASNPPQQQWIVEADAHEVIVMDNTDRSLMRVPVTVDGDTVTFGSPEKVRAAYVSDGEPVAASRMVFASQAESRPEPTEPPTPVDEPQPPAEPAADPELPAAEPEPVSTDPKEDPVSDLSTDVRSRLGLDATADDAAVLAALDALKTTAVGEPDPALVAASAKTAEENDELRKEVKVLASRMEQVTAELAQTKKDKAETVKASVFNDAVKAGKIAPADREKWEKDYDDAPAVVTRVLASIAPGTAVPVAATGYTGSSDIAPDDDATFEAIMSRLDGPTATTGGN